MVITETYVYRLARQCIAAHGETAGERARERVLDLQRRGDLVGADLWRRVASAIDDPQQQGLDALIGTATR
ncbi:MAG TPA: hypothetical protein VET85_00830 [Stellaceae bacterium]|nr:hypothetical protein [Stellaceae bacterium]